MLDAIPACSLQPLSLNHRCSYTYLAILLCYNWVLLLNFILENTSYTPRLLHVCSAQIYVLAMAVSKQHKQLSKATLLPIAWAGQGWIARNVPSMHTLWTPATYPCIINSAKLMRACHWIMYMLTGTWCSYQKSFTIEATHLWYKLT